VSSAVAGLLALLGIEADPIRSREHILLSAILDAAWRKGQGPDVAALIQAVQKPPFDKVGVFDLESFYAAKERMDLALRINGLLAAPGFEAWLHGDALDVSKLLYTESGKPRIAIISIAHLNDAERMFVVTLVANELVAWMRRQPGTTSLRAIFYMDEVFGYFPPTAMPPSKLPMLTLMKQARAFGVGVVLATQNPVDLDYKGLGNAGTWFIGRLQTERDKNRVVEGLLGSDAAAGMDRASLEALMSSLSQRTFLMRNVHDDAPVVFRTRWAMSYLRGPLTLNEIKRLRQPDADGAAETAGATAPAATAAVSPGTAGSAAQGAREARAPGSRPVLQAGVMERFLLAPGSAGPPTYQPRLGARVRARFVDAKLGIDAWESWYYLAPIGNEGPDWANAEVIAVPEPGFADGPQDGARYAELPAAALSPRAHRGWAAALEDYVYRSASLSVLRCPELGLTAAPGGKEAEFRARIALSLREKRDDAVARLRRRYESKIATLEDRGRRAEQKVERERAQASSETMSSALSVGGSLLGALLGGRRSSALRKASTAARRVGRVGKERADVEHAEADAQAIRERIEALNEELAAEIATLESELDANAIRVEAVPVRPRKTDIAVEDMALVWRP
jgi:hypothetical protein